MTLRQALVHLRHSRRGGDAGNHAQVALDLRAKASLATIDPRARAVIATTLRSTRLTRERVLWHSPRPILQRYGIIPKGSRWHSFSVQGDRPGKRRCAKRWHNCATHRRAVLQQHLPYRRSAAGHHTRPRRRAREDRGHDTTVCKVHGSIGRAVAEFMAKALSGSEGDATGIVAAATFSEHPLSPSAELEAPRPWHSMRPVASTECAHRGGAQPRSLGLARESPALSQPFRLRRFSRTQTVRQALSQLRHSPCVSRLPRCCPPVRPQVAPQDCRHFDRDWDATIHRRGDSRCRHGDNRPNEVGDQPARRVPDVPAFQSREPGRLRAQIQAWGFRAEVCSINRLPNATAIALRQSLGSD